MPPRGARRDSKAAAAANTTAAPAAAAAAAPAPAVKAEPPAATSDSDSSQPDEDNAADSSDAPMQTAAEATAALRMPAASPSLMQSASLILPTSSVLQQHKQAGVGNLGAVTAPTGIARFSTMGPHGASNALSASGVAPLPNVGGFVAGGALSSMQGGPIGGGGAGFSRQVSRLPSVGLNGTVQSGDWRALVSVEERITIRRRLREAYLRHCVSYNDLLDTATAVDEELLFACSTNRIDFFKSSIDWDTRIQIKCQQLKNPLTATGAGGAAAASSPPPASNGMGAKKRSIDDAAGGNLSASSTSLLAASLFGNADLTALHAAPAAASSSAASSTLQLPPVSQLRASGNVAFPAASVPVDLANLLAAGDAAAAQANKKQRT